MNDVPRRAQVQSMTPAELAIRFAAAEVEALGPDVRLTDAVVLLAAAKDSVADYVDDIPTRRRVVTEEDRDGV